MSVERLTLRLGVELADFALELDETLDVGAFTALFGPSGSGKSTLLRAIAGLAPPAEGTVELFGKRAPGTLAVADQQQRRVGQPHSSIMPRLLVEAVA